MRKRPSPNQMANILREFQADLESGLNINHACRKAGIGITTYYRWKALGYKTPAEYAPKIERYMPIDEASAY